MGKIGKCCCVDGCTACCISHIEVDIGVPEPGEPGATLGTIEWDVDPEDQPTPVEVAQNVDGTIRSVCRQIYEAPVTIECPGTNAISYNARLLTDERDIEFSHWARLLPFGNFFWFEGEIKFRTYAYIQNLSLTVYRWTTLSRTVLSGVVSQKVFYGPNPGARRRQYASGGCGLIEDINYTSFSEICGDLGECDPFTFVVDRAVGGALFYESIFGITRDSGWVSSECSTLPTNDIGSSTVISSAYNPTASPGPCRVPSGSTYAAGGPTLACTQGGTNYWQHNYTYSSETVWLARHPVRISNCSLTNSIPFADWRLGGYGSYYNLYAELGI